MLEECLKQIFHTALQEKHGSTTKHDENFTDHLSWKHDSESEKDEEEERDFQNAQDTNSSVNSDTSYKLRELKNPIWEYDTKITVEPLITKNTLSLPVSEMLSFLHTLYL